MTTKNRILSVAVIAAICMIVLCAAGVTLAITTSANRGSGSITTAGLNITATVKNVAVYSSVAVNNAENDVYESNGKYYKYVQSNLIGADGTVLFGDRTTGGVRFDEKSVTLENMLPGDKLEFDVAVTSDSTIAFKYRAELFVDSTKGQTLLNNLDFRSQSGLLRKDVSRSNETDGLTQAILTDWTTVSANKTDVDNIHVEIALPISAEQGQGETLKLYYVARAEQSTSTNAPVAEVTFNGATEKFDNLKQAVAYALTNKVDTVTLIGSTNSVNDGGVITVADEGEIYIDRALTFNSKSDSDGSIPLINGARFVIADGAAVTFNNVQFSGASYIDVSNASALTLNNCFADVSFNSDENYFDSESREFLTDTPFVVSSSTLTPVTLRLNGNKILSDGGIVGLRSLINNGSYISDNVFGSSERNIAAAALIFNGGYDSLEADNARAVVSVSNNVIYGVSALVLNSKSSAHDYLVKSCNNVLNGCNGTFVAGSGDKGAFQAAFADNGSTVNNSALQFANIAANGLKFGGINVTFNAYDLIVNGEVTLSNITLADFNANYASGESTAGDIVIRGN